jgi:protein-L-isoaspartate O-methyltransferase
MTQPADLVAASHAHGVHDPRLLEAIAEVPRAQPSSSGAQNAVRRCAWAPAADQMLELV